LGSWTLWQRFSNSMSGDCVEERAAEEEANGIVNREIRKIERSLYGPLVLKNLQKVGGQIQIDLVCCAPKRDLSVFQWCTKYCSSLCCKGSEYRLTL
jgi:xanthine/CO dehydrogenase XdhC/CoxF family maturation factor